MIPPFRFSDVYNIVYKGFIMKNEIFFPQEVSKFIKYCKDIYIDSLKRKINPSTIQKNLYGDYAHVGWVPDWVLSYVIVYLQIETCTVTVEAKKQFLEYIENGDLNLTWKSSQTGETISAVPMELQERIKREVCEAGIWIKPKEILKKISRGDFCVIPLHNGLFSFFTVVKMITASKAIVQLDNKVFTKPPTSIEITNLEPFLPLVGTDLHWARIAYWTSGTLESFLQEKLPFLHAKDNYYRTIYPDALAILVEKHHGYSRKKSFYDLQNSPLNQLAKQARLNGIPIPRPRKNICWSAY